MLGHIHSHPGGPRVGHPCQIIKWNISYQVRRLFLFKVMRRLMMFQRRPHWQTRKKFGLYSSTSPSWRNSATTMSGRNCWRTMWGQLSQPSPTGRLPARMKMPAQSFLLNRLTLESLLEAVWIGYFSIQPIGVVSKNLEAGRNRKDKCCSWVNLFVLTLL